MKEGWKKLGALLLCTVFMGSLELLMSWVFNVSINVALFAGFVGRLTQSEVFAKAFTKKDEAGKRLRLCMGALLILAPQGLAILMPDAFRLTLMSICTALGACLVWLDEWLAEKDAEFNRIVHDPTAISVEQRASMIRVRILELEKMIEPKKDEQIQLREELAELEQKNGYRGR